MTRKTPAPHLRKAEFSPSARSSDAQNAASSQSSLDSSAPLGRSSLLDEELARSGAGAIVDQEGFVLGNPALVCRWRLFGARLPLAHRHLRALRARRLPFGYVSAELVAWVQQHLEWTLERGAAAYPDGVLMLVVDERGRAALSVGPYEPLKNPTLARLSRRAALAADEARATGVVPESVWIYKGARLLSGIDEGARAGGAATLIADLAKTLGIPWSRVNHLAADLVNHPSQVDFDEAFFVSDEHGVIAALGAQGPVSLKLVEAYARLLKRQGSHR